MDRDRPALTAATDEPLGSRVAEVVAATKPLKVGTVLGGEGVYSTCGMVERTEKPGRND